LWVKRTVEEAAPRKSPRAGLSHLAWKSRKDARDFHFFHRPCDDDCGESRFDFSVKKK